MTGAWPPLHMRSFVAVQGPKTDLWLVRMVAALAVAIGVALLLASREPRTSAAVALGIGSALAFLTRDVVSMSKRTIGPIDLGDAAFEVLTLIGWGWPSCNARRTRALRRGPDR